jgi:hypothetical protein
MIGSTYEKDAVFRNPPQHYRCGSALHLRRLRRVENRQWKGGALMIDSVDRIVTSPVRECPLLVEGVLGENALGVLRTAWFTVEPVGDDWFRLTEVNSGCSIESRGDTLVQWLQPQDMNDPVVQAELMLSLREMGMDL